MVRRNSCSWASVALLPSIWGVRGIRGDKEHCFVLHPHCRSSGFFKVGSPNPAWRCIGHVRADLARRLIRQVQAKERKMDTLSYSLKSMRRRNFKKPSKCPRDGRASCNQTKKQTEKKPNGGCMEFDMHRGSRTEDRGGEQRKERTTLRRAQIYALIARQHQHSKGGTSNASTSVFHHGEHQHEPLRREEKPLEEPNEECNRQASASMRYFPSINTISYRSLAMIPALL